MYKLDRFSKIGGSSLSVVLIADEQNAGIFINQGRSRVRLESKGRGLLEFRAILKAVVFALQENDFNGRIGNTDMWLQLSKHSKQMSMSQNGHTVAISSKADFDYIVNALIKEIEDLRKVIVGD